jgi:hypothetical protein
MRLNRANLLLLVGHAFVLLGVATLALAKPGGPAGTQGSYDIILGGELQGDGHAVVTPKAVHVNCKVVDRRTGQKGTLKANNLTLDDGRFNGTGTVFGQTVTVSGRVEAPDGTTVKAARLMCNYAITGGGGAGRIVGQRKGP